MYITITYCITSELNEKLKNKNKKAVNKQCIFSLKHV